MVTALSKSKWSLMGEVGCIPIIRVASYFFLIILIACSQALSEEALSPDIFFGLKIIFAPIFLE